MRATVALTTLVALLFVSGPVCPAQVIGLETPTRKHVPEARSTWPSGTVEEVWHGARSMSLYVAVDRRLMEIRISGDEHHLEMWVTVEGESRFVDYQALLESQSLRRQTRPVLSKARERSSPRATGRPTAGEIHNDEVWRWLDEKIGTSFRIAEIDRTHLDATLLRSALEKGECEGSIRGAAQATAAWLSCIVVAAGSGGSILPFCFMMGAGAHFMTVAALTECNSGGSPRMCFCGGSAPDCMCCDVEPGNVCTCYCPGEPCCDWENTG